MNVPAIAKKTFDELQGTAEYQAIVYLVLNQLAKIHDKYKRAEFVHHFVEECNEEIFSHPLVKELSPCKLGCTGCCHTQVSVTDDEAEVLAKRINEGVEIDYKQLMLQSAARNDSEAFYKLKYEDRRCVFLDESGTCKVYTDRPSVCRTNAVLGTPDQCDTSVSIKPTRLVRTSRADMAIYASFLFAKSSGTLGYMVAKAKGLVKAEE